MNSMKRAGLKLLGLCVLALGLVAFSATAAQAATWMVSGANLATTAQNKELIGKIDLPDGALLAKLGLNKVTFLCKSGSLLSAKLEPEGKVSENNKDAKADFSECATFINEKEAAKCIPTATGKAAGTIESEELFALLQLHSDGTGVIVITPKVGTLLAVIHMGPGCAEGLEVEVFGTLALHDVGVEAPIIEKDELEKERANHLVAEFTPLTKLTAANKESKSTATLDGRADITLAGGGNWSGLKQ
jgi:hypothetical protein